jgi:arginase
MAMTVSRRIVILGVPAAAGASRGGVEGAPRALREAGLMTAMDRAGLQAIDLVDLALFPFREDRDHPRARNAPGVACAIRATADEMTRALPEGFTVVIGGGCSLLAGVVAGVRRHFGRPPGVVLLDAHADLNTEATSPSGFLDGMALALALGLGPDEIRTSDKGPWVEPQAVALVGWRELDPGEREALPRLGTALSAAEARRVGAPEVARRVLAGLPPAPFVAHLDADVLDPAVMPAKGASPPGPALEEDELDDLLKRLLADERAAALLVTGFDSTLDADGHGARVLVDLLAGACASVARGSPGLPQRS